MGSLNEMLASLDQVIGEIPVEMLPAMMTKLSAMQGALAAKMFADASVIRKGTGAAVFTENLLTVPQVAKRLAIPACRAYELARQGRLPVVRIGKYVRVDPRQLEAWIRQRGDASLDKQVSFKDTRSDGHDGR